VSEHDEHQCAVSRAIPAVAPGSGEETLNLIGHQVLAASQRSIGPAARGDFPIFGGWRFARASRQVNDLGHLVLRSFPIRCILEKVRDTEKRRQPVCRQLVSSATRRRRVKEVAEAIIEPLDVRKHPRWGMMRKARRSVYSVPTEL
jgi:hypothetical protein